MARYAALLLAPGGARGLRRRRPSRQEPSLTVTRRRAAGRDRRAGRARPARTRPRIAVVTHGQASSPFWAIVRTGVEAARAPDERAGRLRGARRLLAARMIELIDDAVAAKPDGLVVSFPEPGLAPAIRRAVKAGIPVITINSGSDAFRSLGRARARRPARGPRRARRRPAPRARGRAARAVRQPAGRQRRPRRPLRRAGARHARGRRQLARARHRRPERRPRRGGSRPPWSSGRDRRRSSPPTPPAACSRSTASRSAPRAAA